MKRNRGSIMIAALLVVVLAMALARTWRPAAASPAPPSQVDAPLPRIEPTPVAGPLAAMSVLLYIPGPEVYLPLVLRQ
jgi:hypothetical protein